jgi:hypothetical protein
MSKLIDNECLRWYICTMPKNQIPPFNRLSAETKDRLSSVVSRSKILKHMFMDTDAPSHHSVQWHMADQSIGDIWGWVDFPGNPRKLQKAEALAAAALGAGGEQDGSGRLARSYKKTALLGISRLALDAAQAANTRMGRKTEPAVAYADNQAVMVGVLSDGIEFAADDAYPNRALVGMGIGSKVLSAQMGLWSPEDRRLIVPVGADTKGFGVFYNADFPEHIPRV